MFDFHMHSLVSFDGHADARSMAQAAADRGLKEICFTDHIDDDPKGIITTQCFDIREYSAAYDGLEVPGLTVRKGMEFGLLPDNPETVKKYLAQRDFDFILGSVHYADGEDVYYAPYWQDKDLLTGERRYLENVLECVRRHEDFDVLGHLTYIAKARCNPAHTPVQLSQHRQIVDEILKVLVRKDKGMEINTSGVDRCGDFLPGIDYLRRFRELGGEIVTVGSDAHDVRRVGQYTSHAMEVAKEVFGYVCTFAERKPIFHKL